MIRARLIWAAGAVVAVALLAPTFSLITDVRTTLGTLRVSRAAGLGPGEIFNHRPLLYKELMTWLDLQTSGNVVAREVQWMFLGAVIVAGTGLVLGLALRHILDARTSWLVAAALSLALLWAPTLDFLQPEWFAIPFAVLGFSVALQRLDVRGRVGVALSAGAGALLAVVCLLKYTTATVAAIACLLLLVLNPRRGAWTAAFTLLLSGVLFVSGMLLNPREWQWFLDLPVLNWPLTPDSWVYFWRALVNELMLSPILVSLPAATIVLSGHVRGWRRVAAVLLPLFAVAALSGSFIAQRGWYQYHLAALPSLAAALWALAAGLDLRARGRVNLGLLVPVLAGALAVVWLQAQPEEWREANQAWALGSVGAAALVGAALALLTWARPERSDGRTGLAVAATAFVGTVALGVTIMPWAHVEYLHSDGSNWTRENRLEVRGILGERSEEIRTRIGVGTPVLYLTTGTRAYFQESPAPCRYPLPVFLQRSDTRPTAATATFTDNLACVDDTRARWLLLDDHWMRLKRIDPSIPGAINRNFACERGFRVKVILVCPRR